MSHTYNTSTDKSGIEFGAWNDSPGKKPFTYNFTVQYGDNLFDSTKTEEGKVFYFGDKLALFANGGLGFKGVMDQVVITKERYDIPASLCGMKYETDHTLIFTELDNADQTVTFDRQKGILNIELSGKEYASRAVRALYHHNRSASGGKMNDLPDAWYDLTIKGGVNRWINILKEEDCLTISGHDLDELSIEIRPSYYHEKGQTKSTETVVVNRYEDDLKLNNEEALKIHLDKNGEAGKKIVSCEIVPLPAEEL